MRISIGSILFAIVAFIGLSVVGGSWFTVDEGERAVVTRNGAVTGTAGPGLNFKLPIADSATDFSVRTEIQTYDNLRAYTFDQQQGAFRISVNYQLAADQIEEIYSTYGSETGVVDRLISPRVNSELKNILGRWTAIDVVRKRDVVAAQVRDAIQAAVKGPVLIHGVQFENTEFSAEYEKANERKQVLEAQVVSERQQLEKDKVIAQQAVVKAQGAADSTLAQAEADAKATRLRGEADAAAITAKTKALSEQGLAIVQLTAAEKWDGKMPGTMVPGGALPFVSIPTAK